MNFDRIRRGVSRRINRFRPVRDTTTAQLATEDPSCWRPIYPAWRGTFPDTLPSGPVPGLFRDRLCGQLPAKGVLRLRHASVFGDDGWVFTANGRRVGDTALYVDEPGWMPRIHLPLFRSGARDLPGRTLSLLSNWATINFFHMLIDVIPRTDLLFQAGWKWRDFDQILLPAFSSPTTDRQLAILGLPMNKVISVKWAQLNYFRCDELVCTSHPGGRRTVVPTTIDYLRYLNAPFVPRGKRRLFLQRHARTRHLRNENELLPLLLDRGFEVIDPGALAGAETAFQEAEFIVGAHGGSLANLVFCWSGTKVLELVPSDHAYPYFFTLAVNGGLSYDCLLGKSDHETIRPVGARWNSKSDFTVDVDAFARALDRLLA